LTCCFLLCVLWMNAENGKGTSSFIPYKGPNSMSYGKDIMINNISSEDQRNVHVSVAFNGWLYAVYTHNTASGVAGMTILRSTDDGVTWTVLLDFSAVGSYNAASIVVAGNNLANLKLFVAGVYEDQSSDYNVWCDRIDPQTGIDEDEFFVEGNGSHTIYDVAIASDYRYPSTGSSPYSIGIIYAKWGNPYDSAIILTSSDGGYTIGSRNVVAATSNYCHNVAISYGACTAWYYGRYFVAWEEFETSTATQGHIMAAYTNPHIYSPIVNKIKLDSLDSYSLNGCRNPTIATQFNSINNNMSNLSEIVLFDRYWSAGPDWDVIGFYNLQAVSTTNWQRLNVAVSNDNELQSDINFDPGYNNFLVTYYDFTTEKLPYIVNDMNLENPNTWNVISSGYNDNPNLENPYPKVQINPVVTKVANVWNAERTGGNGVSMFDAEYSTYTGVAQNHQSDIVTLEGAFPNPANDRTNIGFRLNKPANVTIRLYSVFGQEISVLTDDSYGSGSYKIPVDVSALSSGTYIYSFKADDFYTSGRIVVIK